MVIPRKINFLQLGRNGTRSEQCYRQTFERQVDWMEFNLWMSAFNFRHGSRRMGIAIDPSYIPKAGKQPPHIGTFWSGCAGAVKRGLEILGIGLIGVDLHECMMLRAVQTALEKGCEKDEMTLYQWYAKVLHDYRDKLQRASRHIVGDAAFSKRTFVDLILPDGFHLVSRLRSDAVLRYVWEGGPTGRRGRPRVKGDKIDFSNLDKSMMRKLDIDPEDGEAYALKAHCKSLGRVVSLAIHIMPKGGHKLYFSTDENMPGKHVIEYYRTRFQIEFNFRDAKQFTGLTDSQARSSEKHTVGCGFIRVCLWCLNFCVVLCQTLFCSLYSFFFGHLLLLFLLPCDSIYFYIFTIFVFRVNTHIIEIYSPILHDIDNITIVVIHIPQV